VLGLLARRKDTLDALARTLGVPCATYGADVGDVSAVQADAEDFMARHGVPDVVIANAGVSAGTSGGEEERHRMPVHARHGRVDVPRAKGDDGDAASGQLDAQALQPCDRCGLRCRVSPCARQPAEARDARDARENAGAARTHRRHVADVRGVCCARDAQRTRKVVESVHAPRQEAEYRPSTRVVSGERGADPARRARDEDRPGDRGLLLRRRHVFARLVDQGVRSVDHPLRTPARSHQVAAIDH